VVANARTLVLVALAWTVAMLGVSCGGGGDSEETQPFFKQHIALDPSAPERGPNGEPATPIAEVAELTPAEVDKVRKGGYTAALLWAGAGEWYDALGAGASDRFDKLGIKVVAKADAQFDPAKQANDVESAMALKPDIILTLVVDPPTGAAAFRPAVKSNTVLVFADNGAKGYRAGREYVAIVTGDHYGMGQAAAELMNDAIDGEGQIGMIYHDADFFVTNNRDNSFRATIERKYPNITIVDAKGFTQEKATFDIANAMISPKIKGIYVAWDVAAEGVVEALRAAGRTDVKVVSHDLGATNDVAMARGEIYYGVAVDLPYQIGSTMAELAAYKLLGKEAPPFVTGSLMKVTKSNLAEAWQKSLNKKPPAAVTKELGG